MISERENRNGKKRAMEGRGMVSVKDRMQRKGERAIGGRENTRVINLLKYN